MGTKNNPDKFDCYAKAEPDEPMFTLLARDPHGANLVRIWLLLRNQKPEGARQVLEGMIANNPPKKEGDDEKIDAAVNCMGEMAVWRACYR